jgi:SAM-dependent methyltransferase
VGLHQDKLEAQKQWDTDPCGALTAAEPGGTLEFYRAVRAHRYGVHAPWMDGALRFESWAGQRVLEIGVGLGSDHYRFAKAGCEMTALDLSREHLRHTQRHLAMERLATQAILGDAERMPFADASFDLVYSFGVLHHTPATETAVAEVCRVLRPGGTALVALYHRDSFFLWYTALVRGLLRGRLWSLGWRQLLSEIEYRADPGSARPLVKVYSRRQARRLFAGFGDVHIAAHHAQPPLWPPRLRWPPALEVLFAPFGWYLVVHAVKS